VLQSATTGVALPAVGRLQIAGLVVLLAIAAYLAFRRRASRRLTVPSPILPARELQRRYGLYAENRPVIRLDPENVPSSLRDLIPLAETWGIGDDIMRLDFEEKASDAAKRALVSSLGGRIPDVQEWLRSQPAGTGMSEEAAAFMYLLSAWDEVRPLDST
jgi:hypothetical protein